MKTARTKEPSSLAARAVVAPARAGAGAVALAAATALAGLAAVAPPAGRRPCPAWPATSFSFEAVDGARNVEFGA